MSKSRYRIATLNANSIRVRLPQILAWMDDHQADVVCVQETKVQDEDFPLAEIEAAGYQAVFRGKKSYEGVAILSREEAQDVCYGLDDGDEPDEPRLVAATIRGVPILNTYVPQGRSVDSQHFQYKLAWLGRVRRYLERHYAPDQPLVWVGDLNVAPTEIDVYAPERQVKHVDFHPDARAALAEVMTWGLVDVFRQHHPDEPGQFSYFDFRIRNAVDNNLGWRIDHILATEALAAKSVDAWIDVEARRAERPSDHTFVVADFEL